MSPTAGEDLMESEIRRRRERLAARSTTHPQRENTFHDLATALDCSRTLAPSNSSLGEAIILHNNLASARRNYSRVTDSSDLLDEIITRHREALALRPAGHPNRLNSCNELAHGLWQYFRKTKDVTVVDEALALARENAAPESPSEVWRALLILFLFHIEQGSPHFSISDATKYLLQASASLPSTITEFMQEIQSCLDRMWLMHGTWTPDINLLMLDVYSNIIDRLSRMTQAGFAFGTISQLTALISARSFGSDACVLAVLSGRPRQAIELIDDAHGVVCAQTLHYHNLQLQDIPLSLALELEALFCAVSVPMTTQNLAIASPGTRDLSPEDVLDQQNSRIQTLLTEVRAMPGLERFMLGRTYTQIRETAREHPVVVLVSARGHGYALIMRDSTQEDPDVVHLKLTSDRLSLLRDTAARAGLRNGDTPQDIEMQFERAIHISGHKKATPLATLADLWHEVVKPVVDHLQLQVRICRLYLSSLV
jgi:hypothetical protein